MPGQKVLCVAEKPAIAKAVAQHLAGGQLAIHPIRGNQYVKNYEFQYNFPQWGSCQVVMTSVLGHLTTADFEQAYKSWKSCQPLQLFDAPLATAVDRDKTSIATNIATQAKYSKILFIWTDCDREGEHIGAEILNEAKKGNPRLIVKRARFSNTEKVHVVHAARNPVELDFRQASAVDARIELDLRIGAAFTRLQTLQLQALSDNLKDMTISYGSCQFPTLGFVVDRYHRVRNFQPESFWLLKVVHQRDRIKVNFGWRRGHLFDRAVVTILFEQCLDHKLAKIVKVDQKPKSKWRPLPLTTVELQMQGSRFLRMSSSEIMSVAEKLYNKGFLSYPRTETDQFPRDFNLHLLVQKQVQHPDWGQYAQSLLDGGFRTPRSGRNNDQAHPPIHPVNFCGPGALDAQEKKVYEFVTRRFLGCCSEDAKGQATDIEMEWGPERFHAHGLMVLERNYLDVYVYDKWESSQQLPTYTLGETFDPTEATMVDGHTTPPSYLTEPELIGLMDANGIGTDATMAEHIAKIQDRKYAQTKAKAGSNNRIREFIPTTLGVGILEGYDNLGLEVSMSKPFLRKEMELQMKAICDGRKEKADMVYESLHAYRDVFIRTQRDINVLKQAVSRYVLGGS